MAVLLAVAAVLVVGVRSGSWYGTGAAAGAVLAVVALQARGLRSGDPGFGFFCAVFIAGGLTALFWDPATNHTIVQAGLPPTVVYLLGCVLSNIATFSVLSMLASTLEENGSSGRRRTIRRVLTLLGSIIAMTVLAIGLHNPPNVATFPAHGGEPRLDWIRAIYALYIAVGVTEFLVICSRYLRREEPPRRVVISVWLEISGGVLAFVLAGRQIAGAWADQYGGNAVLDNTTISEILSAATFAPMVLGATWLVWAPAVMERLLLGWAWWAVHAMAPLHNALPADLLLDCDDDDLGVQRTWITGEIQDVRIALEPYVHPGIAERVRAAPMRRSRAKTEALVKAAELASALDAFDDECRTDTAAQRANRVRQLLAHATDIAPHTATIFVKITPAGIETYEDMPDIAAEPVSLKAQIAQDLPLIRLARAFRHAEVTRLREWARHDRASASAPLAV
ncbi:DUF6545 domain-containing protein [Amycolatopsis viridis]|uniref:DUF6545 domain-containing protein n=1 Tax=Amycolatopsis viridis TaxID=185678 RepID=A0ABX0SYZ9_9PSEU|nr:DUF6545 domain-containing protein [Amycolatopsis viridis]NIH82182.1 hypothetical protein [Amycolatopsis viridis]